MSVVENTLLERETFAKTKADEHAGQSHPLGATVDSGGVNFSIFSRVRPAWICCSLIEWRTDGLCA